MRRLLFILTIFALCVQSAAADPVVAGQVSITSSPTLIYTAPAYRVKVLIRSTAASASVFVGPSTVSTTTGLAVAAGDAVSTPLDPFATVWGVVAASSETIHYLVARDPS